MQALQGKAGTLGLVECPLAGGRDPWLERGTDMPYKF